MKRRVKRPLAPGPAAAWVESVAFTKQQEADLRQALGGRRSKRESDEEVARRLEAIRAFCEREHTAIRIVRNHSLSAVGVRDSLQQMRDLARKLRKRIGALDIETTRLMIDPARKMYGPTHDPERLARELDAFANICTGALDLSLLRLKGGKPAPKLGLVAQLAKLTHPWGIRVSHTEDSRFLRLATIVFEICDAGNAEHAIRAWQGTKQGVSARNSAA